MQIVVRGGASQEIEQQEALEILTAELQRVMHRFSKASLYIEDVDGPRRGTDKQCRCVLYVPRMRPIVICDKCSDVRPLLRRVANHAVRVLFQRGNRRRATRRRSRARMLAEQ